MTLTDSDKLWIQQNVNGEPKYQMTYMTGPINVTVRLNDIKAVVPAVEELVKEARENEDLNAKVKIPTPEEMIDPDKTVRSTCKVCKSEMVQRSGIAKTGKNKGKPYTALFCPDRNCKGNPIWL